MDYLKIIISVVLAVIGWVVGHYFTSKRQINDKRREIRVKFLIEAYQKLENAIQRRPEDVGSDLEFVVANIQLFGSRNQVNLAKNIANDIANQGSADLEALLISLRADLRSELNLEPADDGIQFLRMVRENT